MLSTLSATYGFAPSTSVLPTASRASAVRMETPADLEVLAKKLNPVVGFW